MTMANITVLSSEDLDAVSGGRVVIRGNAAAGGAANGGNFDITATRGGVIGVAQANGGVAGGGGGINVGVDD